MAARRRSLALLGAAFAALLVAPLALAHGPRDAAFDEREALKVSQGAIGRGVANHQFTTPDGARPVFEDFRGRPVVVSMIYTSCAHACPVTTQSLRRAVEVAQQALGPDAFAVITVGFDSRNDTPSRMRDYARAQAVDLPNWSFLSADHDTADRLAAELGFLYKETPVGFDHLSQTTVVDASGRVSAQVYGTDFAAPALVEPLKDLIYGRRAPLTSVEGLVSRIKLICTVYDPTSGRYRFSYAVFVGYSIGLASLVAVLIFLVRSWRDMRRARA